MNSTQWIIIILLVGFLVAMAIHMFSGYSTRQWLYGICIESVEKMKKDSAEYFGRLIELRKEEGELKTEILASKDKDWDNARDAYGGDREDE